MTLTHSRRVAAPMAVVTLISFLATLMPPLDAKADALAPVPNGTGGASTLSSSPPAANTPQALANVELSTGAAQSALPFHLPTARGDAQPRLGLAYNSSSGIGFAGIGWTLDVPSIVRQPGVGGIAQYQDRVLQANVSLEGTGSAQFDEYTSAGSRLIPICKVQGTACTGGGIDTFPASFNGWVYFRRETDDGLRYFFSPDGQTWRVQSKAGHELQFGKPLDGYFSPAIEQPDPSTLFPVADVAKGPIGAHRWNLVREADSSGNTVYYLYTTLPDNVLPAGTHVPGIQYLTDIYDTLQVGATPSASAFAHRVHVSWTAQSSVPPTLYDPIWRAIPFAAIGRVDITSASWSSTQRNVLRSYIMTYWPNAWGTQSYLHQVTENGECSTAQSEQPDPPTYMCPPLRSTTYTYNGVTENPQSLPVINGFVATPGVTGGTYTGGTTVASTLVDLNGDGTADLVSGPYSVPPQDGLGPPTSYLSYSLNGATGQGIIVQDPASAPDPSCTVEGNCPPHATLADLAPGSPNVVYGDWLSTGTPNWLWLGPPATAPITEEGLGGAYEIYFVNVDNAGFPQPCFSRTPRMATSPSLKRLRYPAWEAQPSRACR